MVIAEDGLLVQQTVQCEVDIGFDRAARFIRCTDLALQTRNAFLRDRLVGERERLRADELVVHLQEAIEHPRS